MNKTYSLAVERQKQERADINVEIPAFMNITEDMLANAEVEGDGCDRPQLSIKLDRGLTKRLLKGFPLRAYLNDAKFDSGGVRWRNRMIFLSDLPMIKQLEELLGEEIETSTDVYLNLSVGYKAAYHKDAEGKVKRRMQKNTYTGEMQLRDHISWRFIVQLSLVIEGDYYDVVDEYTEVECY